MEQVIAENVDNCSDKSEITDQNTEKDLLSEYREAVKWFERARNELRSDENNQLSFVQMCTEQAASLVAMLYHSDQNNSRREVLNEIYETVNFLSGKLGNVSLSSPDEASETSIDDQTSFIEQDISLPMPEKTLHAPECQNDTRCSARQQAIEETLVRNNDVTFDSVVGLEEAKRSLKEAVVMPLLYPHLFSGNRKPWTRILLYGPPGTGKSRLAHAIASEIDFAFYSVSSSDLLSSWFGESEKMIRDLFEHSRNVNIRSVIFMDEIDSLCRKRKEGEEEGVRRIKTELLRQMDGITSNYGMFLLCATNCPWELDSAFLRRFQKRVYIPLPDEPSRISILKLHAGEERILNQSEWSELGRQTDGYSGSDLANLANAALFEPMRELHSAKRWKISPDGRYSPCFSQEDIGTIEANLKDLPPAFVETRALSLDDFKTCLHSSKPTVNSSDLKLFESFTAKFGQVGS
ncbi:uncharacterized protein LOC143445576 [Clavelina lepadiformis]|uniref:uncharacterized protein LOC143445576 n=1 Tax=Clavelina lepadiformis TaxID=159417 RepID=UPI0040411FEE